MLSAQMCKNYEVTNVCSKKVFEIDFFFHPINLNKLTLFV